MRLREKKAKTGPGGAGAKYVFAALTILILCFIWGQSLMPKDASARESSWLMSLLKPLLDPDGSIPEDIFHHYLRKTAHFTEYAALGFCACGFSAAAGKRGALRFAVPAACCAVAAAIDECIQLFSEGRGARPGDVLLDICGALCGAAVMLISARLWRRARRGRTGKKKE